jgi:xanthine dehydrogenase accessory factor
MLEIASALLDRLDAGRRVAVATVTRVDGSAPRDLGTSMAVDDEGRVVGSISGGCVEGAVVEVAERVLASGAAERASFGIADEQAFAVGLSCGGRIEVLVRPLGDERAPLDDAARGASTGSAVVAAGPAGLLGRAVGSVTDAELAAAGVHGLSSARLRASADARIAAGWTGALPVRCEGAELSLFVESRLAPPAMIVVGAVDFARALSDAAALLGYRVAVVDPRALFATPARFPAAAEVIAGFADEVIDARAADLDARAVVAVLGHGDDTVPAILAALRSPAGYVGALGSRRTHERRVRMLRDAGATERELARLHSPIGLDLGAATPEETAVSILAEVIAERSRRDARPLRDGAGPIHARRDEPGDADETAPGVARVGGA